MMLDGTIYPGKKPDFDNIGKICCDALMALPSTTMRRLWMAE